MSNPTKWLAALFAFAALAGPASAATLTGVASGTISGTPQFSGTPANTPISNVARAEYLIGSNDFTANTPTPAVFTVDERIQSDVTVLVTPVSVEPDEQDAILSYLVTNLGNGNELFDIGLNPNVVEGRVIAGDFFNPSNMLLYADDGDGVCTAADITGSALVPGTDELSLVAGGEILLCGFGDIPDSQGAGDEADVSVTVISATAGAAAAAAGDSLGGVGDGGVDAVVIDANATAEGIGTYVVVGVLVTIDKTIVATDDTPVLGGAGDATNGAPIPGAIVTYQLVVTVTGAGTAEALNVIDELPLPDLSAGGTGGIVYVPDSFNVNGQDFDDGETIAGRTVTIATSGGITRLTVSLGSVPGAPAPGVSIPITFAAEIQ